MRDTALLTGGYRPLLRRVELVSISVGDLLPEIDATATVLVPSGKTDSEGHGATLYLARGAVGLVRGWLAVAGIGGGTCSGS